MILKILTTVVALSAVSPAFARAEGMERFLPTPSCAANWNMDGKPALFGKDSLFDRINGESELYFPYGFRSLAYARYESRQNPEVALDADVYEMGSLLDAFGMFANYRKKTDADLAAGAGGVVNESQAFFYQDRYFVRLQVTGAVSAPRETITACAVAVANLLPRNAARPRELEALDVPGVIGKTERYIAQSLLGYEFFRRGLIAETGLNNGQTKVFIVLEESPAAAHNALERYRAYLVSSGGAIKKSAAFAGVDSLYGNVIMKQAGACIVGLIRVDDVAAAGTMADQIAARIK